MPRARNAICAIVFAPDNLRMLREVFDAAWACVAADFGDHPDRIEATRIRLATIILELAEDGQLGPDQITRTALRLIRQAGGQDDD